MTVRFRSVSRFALLGALLLPAFAASAASDSAMAGIAVDGEGEVRVIPDRAELAVAVEVRDDEAEPAMERANAITATFLASARELGVADKDLRSTSLRLMPEYRWDDETRERVQTGFSARRDITVQIRALDRLARFLTAASEAGVTHIEPPRLYASDAAAHRREALASATRAARANAQAIADAAGVTLGAITEVNAQQSQGRPVEPVAMRAMAESSAPANADSGINIGEMVYSATVRARYAIAR